MTSMLFARLPELFHFAIALLLLPSLNVQPTWTVTDGTATATLTDDRLIITITEPRQVVRIRLFPPDGQTAFAPENEIIRRFETDGQWSCYDTRQMTPYFVYCDGAGTIEIELFDSAEFTGHIQHQTCPAGRCRLQIERVER